MTTAPSAGRQALQRHTRRPTGKPSWPILLLAGREKSGKSWSCAEASGSKLVGRTLWVGIGEDDPDEYALIPGADFEIVTHDGTYRDILAAIEWASEQTSPDGRPVLLVVDSMTCLWELLCDMAQAAANQRASRKGKATDEADIHMDLWNIAKSRFANVVDALRAHQGPVLVTARMEQVTVMSNGKPTTDKEWKVKTEKGLPYEVAGIIEMPERGKAYLAGVKTARMKVPERTVIPGFTVDKLWHSLGLAEVEIGERNHSGVSKERALAPVEDMPRKGDDRTSDQDTRQITETALTVAVRAGKTPDVDTLRRTYSGLPPAALAVDIRGALPAEWLERVPDLPAGPIALGPWLIACGTYAKANGTAVNGDEIDPTTDAPPATAGADTPPAEGTDPTPEG